MTAIGSLGESAAGAATLVPQNTAAQERTAEERTVKSNDLTAES